MELWEVYKKRYPVLDIDTDSVIHSPINIIIVIPSFKEPELTKTLNSLNQCSPTDANIEVIVVLNHSEGTETDIVRLHKEQIEYCRNFQFKQGIRLSVIYLENIPTKKAGVGYARKVGMDIAAKRIIKSGNPDGIIVCLDADCLVCENYIIALTEAEKLKPNSISIAFEHRFDNLDEKQLYGIVHYELFLRYYNIALALIGYPFGSYTIGSAMGVSASCYLKSGGMNQRKAGEDFYFMNKILPLGEHVFLSNCTVFPSSRTSDRVPFGTGRALQQWLENKQDPALTYHPDSFKLIKDFFVQTLEKLKNSSSDLSNFPTEFSCFIAQELVEQKLKEIIKNTSSIDAAQKRFFQWFDAFLIMKLLNYLRDEVHGRIHVVEALRVICKDEASFNFEDPNQLLFQLRQIEKENRPLGGLFYLL